ncbi:KDPG/KHG aldolase [Roseiarcus fermentans]|uniref:KDPG/KHG aldolase n=1 Tax=Roseiarcus fermentans TaxID=1473586 RepID=A0A366FTV4_9HYPH|nr:hypothetical protein [Roseiarcus fermentans]RBP18114.1 KDPG/KHG aldolase [Roseiarcus fermentans]
MTDAITSAIEAVGIVPVVALVGPYPDIRFVPTGGIGPETLASYLALPSVAACGGSWMVEPKSINAGDFDAVERITADAARLARIVPTTP